jgi:ADP-glucose pyrophosphorylase
MALFGMTAKQWRETNPDAEGNIRDNATIEQLVVFEQYGKHQCRADPAGFRPKRTTGRVEQNCHYADAVVDENVRIAD